MESKSNTNSTNSNKSKKIGIKLIPDNMIYLESDALDSYEGDKKSKYEIIKSEAKNLSQARLEYSKKNYNIGNKMSCSALLLRVDGDQYEQIFKWDLLSDELRQEKYKNDQNLESLKKLYEDAVNKSEVFYEDRKDIEVSNFVKITKSISNILFDSSFFKLHKITLNNDKPQFTPKVLGWDVPKPEIVNKDNVLYYLSYFYSKSTDKQKNYGSWQEGFDIKSYDSIYSTLSNFMNNYGKKSDESQQKDRDKIESLCQELKPVMESLTIIDQNINYDRKDDLKKTDKTLHTEAYLLAVDLSKLWQEIDNKLIDGKISNSQTNLESQEEQKINKESSHNYRLYNIISSSLDAYNPCSLLVSSHFTEELKNSIKNSDIKITNFYISDNVYEHSDKSSDKGWENKEKQNFNNQSNVSSESYDKTMFITKKWDIVSEKGKEGNIVVNSREVLSEGGEPHQNNNKIFFIKSSEEGPKNFINKDSNIKYKKLKENSPQSKQM